MVDLYSLLSLTFGGNSVQEYLIALGIFAVIVLVFKLIKFGVIHKLHELSKKTHNQVDDLIIGVIASVTWPFYVVLAAYIAIRWITVPDIVSKVFYYIILIVALYYIVKAINSIIKFVAKTVREKREKEEEQADTSVIRLISNVCQALVWLAAVLILLQNFGVNITTLIAGIGVAGIAIAFALQKVLEDIFASISIYFDKPFKSGEYIVIGDDSGTVQHIGIKSTRIKTLQGEELVVSNRELTSARIRNFKKMEDRRVVFSIGVTYDTPVSKMRKIPGIIAKVFDKVPLGTLDRCHFKTFSASSLDYEIVYHVGSTDYNDYMDTQQELNLLIKQEFDKLKIEFAFPTQTIYVAK
ncbi:mechanosensitive ion channel family protein [Candidatus Woesearchaeota archaeon]|nr:mechanosensitive ion channel family protein [Candidatus Woesearchaeota archaeon]MBW3022076.1 mechanosensitive ion channel family protein [Candidatus Woesearchaeota archaeon]